MRCYAAKAGTHDWCPGLRANVVAFVVLTLLLLFVGWGARTNPNRPFSWGMYSGSTKCFFWTDVAGRPRALSYDELRLAPESHFLSLSELRWLVSQRHQQIPFQGLIIGSHGNWLVSYDGDPHLRTETPLSAGAELDHLVALLRRFPHR